MANIKPEIVAQSSDKLCTVIVPPNIQVALTGAWMLRKGVLDSTLFYTDGSVETVRTDSIPASTDWSNWFSIVGGIQSLR